jgi:hypothetical protein
MPTSKSCKLNSLVCRARQEVHVRNRSGLLTLAALLGSVTLAACAADVASKALAPTNRPTLDIAATCNPDMTAPVISSVSASPNSLWAPNHKMVPVSVSIVATDNCVTPTCAISSVSSNEPINGLGDGNTSPDWAITSPTTLLLRAERAGVGSGRVYTIGVTCTDGVNTALGSTTVTVPHDQGKKG